MNKSFWRSRTGIITIFVTIAVSYFIVTEHRAHAIAFLPYLILLLCPLMHLFMHRGHGHHGSNSNNDSPQNKKMDSSGQAEEEAYRRGMEDGQRQAEQRSERKGK
ncbi:DUF2933 domain-containing protein [Corallincola holothuriorum]|uniref:DUF2933 domain-containing protein n=1 Tax=Corallincola holothuriorum TaxID=2282215 RepID=A0A368NMC2_9GAMM|nr:DUF2933 domain-containing protein [Corallincola holothuriorum]RCU51043.1 DUF2933 domain-containing protein [Corallincola holothuriorum]